MIPVEERFAEEDIVGEGVVVGIEVTETVFVGVFEGRDASDAVAVIFVAIVSVEMWSYQLVLLAQFGVNTPILISYVPLLSNGGMAENFVPPLVVLYCHTLALDELYNSMSTMLPL